MNVVLVSFAKRLAREWDRKEHSWPLEWSQFGGDNKSRSVTWGLSGLCESVLSPSGLLILFPRIRSLLTHFPLFSDIKPNYMGTPGWACVCVWYMCVCECAHVCLCAQVWMCVGESESCSVMSTLWSHVLYKSMEFSRPEYWSGWTFPNPGGLSNPRIEPRSPTLQVILYQLSHKGSPRLREWVAYPFCSRSSQPRNRTGVFCIASGFFTNWAIRQDPGVLVLTHYFCYHCSQCSGSRCKEIESLRVTVGHSFGMNRTGY